MTVGHGRCYPVCLAHMNMTAGIHNEMLWVYSVIQDGKGFTYDAVSSVKRKGLTVSKQGNKAGRRVKQTADSEAVYASLDDALVDTKKFWDFIGAPRSFSKKRRAIL